MLKDKFKKWFGKKEERVENLSIFCIILGAILISLGLGLSVISTQGLPAILTMVGSFLVFVFSIVFVIVNLVKS